MFLFSLCVRMNWCLTKKCHKLPPERKKSSSAQTAEHGGSTPSGEVIFRLIGLCGFHWTWRHPPPTGLRSFLFGAVQTPQGNISPQLSSTFFFFSCSILEVLLPTQFQLAFTPKQHASLVPTHVTSSESSGGIYSITIFRFFHLVCIVKHRLYQIAYWSLLPRS